MSVNSVMFWILAPASQAALISAEQAWGLWRCGAPLPPLAFLMRHVEFVEHFVGRFADGERVHQEATEPEAAAEIVVFSTTMTFTPCSASSLAAISSRDRHRR